MPLTVIVRDPTGDDGGAQPLTFDGDRVVLGRGTFADVRLPDPSVSARHATVRAAGGEYHLVDESSTNGTFVGGIRLAPHSPRSLRSGDLVRLGRVWIEVRLHGAPVTADPQLATRDLAFRLVERAMAAIGDEVSPTVRVVEGADLGRRLSLAVEGQVYVVGRGETCSLPIADPDASRSHVQVVRRASGVFVQDMGAKNRAVLGDAWVPSDRFVPWRRPAMLRVGTSVLALDEPVADALAELESAPDEPLPEPQLAPEPPPLAAGIAAPATPSTPSRSKRADPGAWTLTDLAVACAALVVITLSALGLYWLLRAS